MTLDRFYLIVDNTAWLERLLPQGVRLVQLRIKDREEAEISAEIAKAKQLCAQYGAQLIVNDFWRQAIEFGCDFIHLGQGDLDAADMPAIRRAGLKLGISTHDEAELERALSLAPDYVALGPIYPTILKKMPFAPQGLEKIGIWKRRIGALPLIAIGGIKLPQAANVLAAGADSVAVVTDISLNENPEQRARDWIAATR
jgi:thiamine-phosphate pyrophosphorylase